MIDDLALEERKFRLQYDSYVEDCKLFKSTPITFEEFLVGEVIHLLNGDDKK